MNTRTLTTISIALLCAFYSCSTPPNNTAAQRSKDSLALQAKATALAKLMMQHEKDSLAHADILFDRYTRGYSLIESLYMASPHLHWKEIFVGDPLCAPYAP